jgi:ribosomal protein S18 acetylase RimI-like enzyme
MAGLDFFPTISGAADAHSRNWQQTAYETAAVLAAAALGAAALYASRGEAMPALARAGAGLEESGLAAMTAQGERVSPLFSEAYGAVAKAVSGTTRLPDAAAAVSAGSHDVTAALGSAEGLVPRAVESADASLPATVARSARLNGGAKFTFINPKTGAQLDTTVVANELEGGQQGAALVTHDDKLVGNVVYSASRPGHPNAIDSLYGQPPTQKPFLWLDYLSVEPEFRGQGVKEALIDEMKSHSQSLGFGGRLKLFAYTDDGTISAIPWYKSGFRPVPSSILSGERFSRISDLLKGVVDSKMKLSLEQGQAFDSLMMELPER